MPREPTGPFAFTLSQLAALIAAAGPMPGEGMLYLFTPGWDPEWWPLAANDEKVGASDQEEQHGQEEAR